MKPERIGVLTGGGDCPGLNAVIRAVAKTLISRFDVDVIGIEDGFQGLIEKRFIQLDWNAVSGILQRGGTILGTSNVSDPFQYPVRRGGKTHLEDYSEQSILNARDMGLDAVICIGGDGTMTVAHKMMQKGLNVVGVPKTIDNDLFGTDVTFGYDTAMAIAAEAIDRIHTTAMSHHRVMLVEVMGRYAGWLTLGAGMASGADIILLPEFEYDLDIIAEVVKERSYRGRRFSIITVSEGAKPRGGELTVARTIENSPEAIRLGGVALKLGNDIEDATGLETRATVLGHLQRGGTPTAFDRVLATRFGVHAAELAAAGEFGFMVGLHGDEIKNIPIDEIGGKTRRILADDPILRVAQSTGVSLGTRDVMIEK